MTIRPASDRSLLVTLADGISFEAYRRVFSLTRALSGARAVVNLHPAFTTVLVEFDPRMARHEEIEDLIRARWERAAEATEGAVREVALSVRYGGECGPDLDDVAAHAGLSAAQTIELHASARYVVYFLGFATAFVYLGGLPDEIATPRLAAPRKSVPAGSVAIAGTQAGIYPVASPGGWRVIGRTDTRLFDPKASPPPLLRMGDRVRFVPEAG